jgi:hypothetical protein
MDRTNGTDANGRKRTVAEQALSRVAPHAWQSPLHLFGGGINKDKFCSVLRATTTDVIAVGFRIPVAMSVYEGKPTLIIGSSRSLCTILIFH